MKKYEVYMHLKDFKPNICWLNENEGLNEDDTFDLYQLINLIPHTIDNDFIKIDKIIWAKNAVSFELTTKQDLTIQEAVILSKLDLIFEIETVQQAFQNLSKKEIVRDYFFGFEEDYYVVKNWLSTCH